MKENVTTRLANLDIPKSAKDAFMSLYNVARTVKFGKISPRQEGYILGSYKMPRCTSVLQMDGSKAGALAEWGKRQVAARAKELLLAHIGKSNVLTSDDINHVCQIALLDPDKQKTDAATAGTQHHDNFENWLMGYEFVDNEPLNRFKQAWNAFGGICVATEVPLLWHKGKLGFGGKLDILAYKDGKWWIGDNKTSRSVHDSYGCQTSAYANAVEQMTNGKIKIEGAVIFHIPDLNTMSEKQKKEYNENGSTLYVKNMGEAFEHYRLLLGLYSKRNNRYF